MKIKALELFKNGRDTYQAGEIYEVADEWGAHFCMAGWAEDLSGEIPTRPRKTGQHVKLDVHDVYESGARLKVIADAANSAERQRIAKRPRSKPKAIGRDKFRELRGSLRRDPEYAELRDALGDDAPAKKTLQNWISEFKKSD